MTGRVYNNNIKSNTSYRRPAEPDNQGRRPSWMDWAFSYRGAPSQSHHISQNEYTKNLWDNRNNRRRSSASSTGRRSSASSTGSN
ncbi:hypothetical protein TRICI_002515 [Trichomonascus ciferrii]|uniref:Uncharacterized protein n=1 Tax=Trichomonascus ciferrii TaxID=44093 RepID=A0A642V6J9_9ASCO|nr:hypothetical protein TRICI_002515 [Trichomonascus ciferrii]